MLTKLGLDDLLCDPSHRCDQPGSYARDDNLEEPLSTGGDGAALGVEMQREDLATDVP